MIIQADDTGRIVAIDYTTAEPKEGWTALAALPPMPQESLGRGWRHELFLRGGEAVWETVYEEPPPLPEPEEPTIEEAREAVREARQAAYRERVDPLTAEITRLRDMAPDDPRIAEAEAEREAAVAAVVAENPYPEEA